MYLAQNLKYLREQKGQTQADLAKVFGVKQPTVGNWEAGERKLDIEMIIRLAEYFGVTLDDLVLRDLRPPKPMCASNLKYLREKYVMSQEDMAQLLKTSKPSVSKYENGLVRLSIEQLMKISEYFAVTLDQFVKQDLSKEQ